MKSQIDISVIMSVFNTDVKFLKQSIESILNQTISNFEFIIFDDASNEETSKILYQYASNDKRIVLIRNEVNKGLTYNLYKGIIISKGKYICRQDADDISYNNRFEKQIRFMQENLDIDILGTGYYLLKNNKLKKRSFGGIKPEYIKARLFLENTHIMHGSIMIRKSFLEKYNLNYNTDIKKSQDYDLWIRASRCGKITILKEYLCIYRQHSNQISLSKATKIEQKKYFYEAVLRQLDDINIKPKENEKMLHLALSSREIKVSFKEITKWTIKLLKNRHIDNVYNKLFFYYIVIKRYMKYIAYNSIGWII